MKWLPLLTLVLVVSSCTDCEDDGAIIPSLCTDTEVRETQDVDSPISRELFTGDWTVVSRLTCGIAGCNEQLIAPTLTYMLSLEMDGSAVTTGEPPVDIVFLPASGYSIDTSSSNTSIVFTRADSLGTASFNTNLIEVGACRFTVSDGAQGSITFGRITY